MDDLEIDPRVNSDTGQGKVAIVGPCLVLVEHMVALYRKAGLRSKRPKISGNFSSHVLDPHPPVAAQCLPPALDHRLLLDDRIEQ